MSRAAITSLPAATLAAWQTLAEAMLHPAWLVLADPLPRIVAVNAAGAALIGLQADALDATPLLALLASPEDDAFWNDAAGRASEDGGRLESDTLLRRPDGSMLPVRRKVTPLADSGGAIYVVALHDRSRQLQAERELELSLTDLRATLESTHDGILVTDLG